MVGEAKREEKGIWYDLRNKQVDLRVKKFFCFWEIGVQTCGRMTTFVVDEVRLLELMR